MNQELLVINGFSKHFNSKIFLNGYWFVTFMKIFQQAYSDFEGNVTPTWEESVQLANITEINKPDQRVWLTAYGGLLNRQVLVIFGYHPLLCIMITMYVAVFSYFVPQNVTTYSTLSLSYWK